uniref:Uncharacterized protein n=1 Tax=Arundo donax TaxID=35708 RepID=A0A0A9GNJ8_ARUDO
MLGKLDIPQDAKLKNSILGKDTSDELFSPSATSSSLFERFRTVRFCISNNEISCTVPTNLFEWSKRVCNRVKFEICGGIFPENLQLYNANFVNSLKFPTEEGTGPDNPQ